VPNPKSTHEPCVHQGCPSQAKSYGRCLTHYWQLKRSQPEELVRLKAMTPSEREHEFYKLNHPPLPKWQYEPTEQQVAYLAELMENQDRKRLESEENANGPRRNEPDEIR
jgi:hypothetical protein